jgi:two-component system chemotaxis response regulator CheY
MAILIQDVAAHEAAATTDASPVKKTLRILYADDVRELREIIRIGLGREGHSVDIVEDGCRALEKVSTESQPYDLILSDHFMPNGTGLELVRGLRSMSFAGKIIIFSSDLSREVCDAYRHLGVDRLLFKPIELPALRRLILEG